MSFTPFASVQSTDNYSQANLSGAATYAGTWEKSLYGQIQIRSLADVAGTLYVDFSSDGGTSTVSTVSYACAANTQEIHRLVAADYFRLRYINGASAQSSFDLSVVHGLFGPLTSSMNFPYSLDSDAFLVRPSLPWLDISRGLAAGVQVIEKFGRNSSVGTSFVPVAMGGVYQAPQSGSATTLRIAAGGDANDTAAGSGARSVTFEGTDENFDLATEAVATAGALASSATTTTFTRLFRAYLTPSTGSGTYAAFTAAGGSHAATITIENGAGGTTWGVIDGTNTAKGQSEIAAYTVPSGYTAYVKPKIVYVDTNRSTDVLLVWRANADETAAPYSARRAQAVVIGATRNVLFGDGDVPYGPYPGPADIVFMAKADSTAVVAVEFEVYLVNE